MQTVLGRVADATHLNLPDSGLPTRTSSQFWERQPAPEPSQLLGLDRSDSQDPTFWMKEF
jgi:hypothetical protein